MKTNVNKAYPAASTPRPATVYPRGVAARNDTDSSDVGLGVRQRATRQRAAVAAAVAGLAEFRSAQQIAEVLHAEGHQIGLSTVYRALQAMVELEQVDVLRGDDGEVRYRRCGHGHHHHLVCRVCGATVEVTGEAVERWADRVAAKHGYTEVSHAVEVFGRCADCAG
jgi:Fur family ferric uptake transcriptional regulator